MLTPLVSLEINLQDVLKSYLTYHRQTPARHDAVPLARPQRATNDGPSTLVRQAVL